MDIIYIYIYTPKAAHQCDVKGNSNITAIAKIKGLVHFRNIYYCFTHEEILMFGQIISP